MRATFTAAVIAGAIAIASGADAGTCPTSAQLQHHTGSGSSVCPCFITGEEAGVVLRAPAEDYPIEILRIGIGWASQFGGAPQSLEEAIHIYGDSLPDPGTPLFSLPGPVLTDGFLNEYDFDPFDVIVNDGPFAVTLEFLNANAGDIFAPSLLFDAGCQSGKNIVQVESGQWFSSCALGVSGDWVMYAVYRACVGALGVGETKVAALQPATLMPARPNPFTREMRTEFVLARAGVATVAVYDAAGRRVARLADGHFEAGAHHVRWDGFTEAGTRAPSGLYFVELRAGEHRARRTVMRVE